MEVRIGVQHVAREIQFESDQSADEVLAALSSAGELLELTDDKGGRIIVPTGAIGYLITGGEKKGSVGFGAQ